MLLSMLYYLGYLTIDPKLSRDERLALKIPNLFMSKLFAECVAEFRFKNSRAFCDYELDISSLRERRDDISAFADSCTDFLSRICSSQMLSHLSEMALNMTLYTKLRSMQDSGLIVEMQKSLRVRGDGEKFADLAVTVNADSADECSYIFELKYLSKSKFADKTLQNLIEEASAQALGYKSAVDFKDRDVKAYAMVFVGADCRYCGILERE